MTMIFLTSCDIYKIFCLTGFTFNKFNSIAMKLIFSVLNDIPEISDPNSSSKAITNSTVSKLSAPKSSIKLASSLPFPLLFQDDLQLFFYFPLISSDMNSFHIMFNFLLDY